MENLQDMPDEFSVDDLIEKLLVLQKIEEGQNQVKEKKILTEEQAKIKLGKWVK